ncbi:MULTISPECIES: hypothetical protein [Hyphomicrobiales]|uniref:hypothetical protein n=1 Tax=Hyphomicrobiales TaxID=356 RepID=UPI000F684092|nr:MULTISPECIES: hypothetical protein [Hyphomicrobiales]MCQ9147386.1 hypothetical protein [Ochrobactrum sp. BTU2]MDH1270296.1 hypothetical protein [Agrobacterium pusense]MDX4076573.1 hypothetical protein [Brucella sp. NBRC 113783]RSC24757.1 hypothetical protein EGT36_28430 [Agrobacterium sp. FDAARGOS_525]
MVDERRDDFGTLIDDDSPSMDALGGSMDIMPLDDEDDEDEVRQLSETDPAVAGWTAQKRDSGEIALEARPKIHGATLSSAELFAEGKLDNKPLGEFLNERGCDGVAPGTSRLWYVGNAEGGGTWMYATAPGIKGAVKPGFDVILAYGEDRNDVEVRICVLLISETADGRWQSLKFRKANAIKMESGKVTAAGAMEEAMVVGALDGKGFGRSPFRFDNERV